MLHMMLISGVLGLLMSGAGLYLLAFTNITCTAGMQGIALVVTLITLGVFFLVPAKVYLIIRLTQAAKRRRNSRQGAA